jgi:hypothetical protein
MNIDNQYYKKYLKYKIKYIELKELQGGKNKINVYGNEYENMKVFITSLNTKKLVSVRYKIYDIETYLLNTLLTELLKKNAGSEEAFENIFHEICNTILNYREYFYLNDKNSSFVPKKKSKPTNFLDLISYLKEANINNIKISQQKINKYLDSLKKISKFKNLRNIIKLYFDYVDECIKKNIYTVIDNNLPLNFDNKSGILNRVNESIPNKIINEINKINDITHNSNNYDILIKKLYTIQKLLKLNVLYNNKNIDDNIMLINNYFIMIKLILANYKQMEIKYKDFLSDNSILNGGSNINRNKVIDILNALLNIIYHNTKGSSTIGTTYILKYNQKNYDLKTQWDILYNDIQKEIEEYLPATEFINKLKQYVDLKLQLQIN